MHIWCISMDSYEKFTNFRKITKNIILETKKWKNRMYGYQKHISSACSEGFKSIQFTTSPENCAQFVQNMFWFFFIGGQGMDRIPPISLDLVSPTMDFHGFSCWSLTLINSNSAMPTSLRMLRHDFNTYSARSRDLGGHYNPKFAARNRKKSEKVGKFRFWVIRRCVRPYHDEFLYWLEDLVKR